MSAPTLRALSESQVRAEKLGGLSRVSFWKICSNPDAAFPQPIVLPGTNIRRWLEPAVDAWLAAQRPPDAVTVEKRAEMRRLGRLGGLSRASLRRRATEADAT